MCIVCDLLGKAAANGGINTGGSRMKEQRKLLVKRNEGKTTEQVREMLKENGFSLDRAVTILESPDAYIYIQDIETVKPAAPVPPTGPAPVEEAIKAGPSKMSAEELLQKAFSQLPKGAKENIEESASWILIGVAMDLLRAKVLKSGLESLTPIELLIAKSFASWLKDAEKSKNP